jgi:adenine-specific DNA-methyltransferase
MVADNRIWFGADGDNVPREKVFMSETRQGITPHTIWAADEVGTTDSATKDLMDIFSGKSVYETPKPLDLIKRIVQISSGPEDIVLDAFGGSGTTGHAVLALNKSDLAHRRFILIESEDYADGLTAERLRRVVNGVPKAKGEAIRKGLGGSFSFIEMGHPMKLEAMLKAEKLPSYEDLASYIFYTATGEDFDPRQIHRKTGFIGESARYDVYLIYEPSLDYLKNTALTLDIARSLPKGSGKKRLVFAPTKYLDSIHLDEHRIEFCQLPFEIYKAAKRNP